MSPLLVSHLISAQAEMARMEAAKIANHIRTSEGLAPAYGEDYFDCLATVLDGLSHSARSLLE